MATKSKRTLAIRAMVDRNNRYAIEEALELVKKMATTKFDESVDVAVGLGIDPRKSDQVVRGAVVLPHGTGK
ncbi:50S ribosomal protein L1, partial [Acidithiobacillus ferridurans]|nr:50S ribosomal protein L1 [Acidithiobacillus ferridurans]